MKSRCPENLEFHIENVYYSVLNFPSLSLENNIDPYYKRNEFTAFQLKNKNCI